MVIMVKLENSDETNYKTQIYKACQWCQSHNLLLNVDKI